MQDESPHYLLFSEAVSDDTQHNRWRFVLQSLGCGQCLSAEDCEPGTCASRLELLAVVRGLEALDQPSRVTLITRSAYVARGIRRGIAQWRARRWRWERFGQLVPIRDCDLWQRVDQALQFHVVDCCGWHADAITVEQLSDPAMITTETSHETLRAPEAAEPPHETKVAACQAADMVKGPALVIVERPRQQTRTVIQTTDSPLTLALTKLRQNVLVPLAAFCRPAFTRAA